MKRFAWQEVLGLETPVCQAPIGGIASGDLAVAVSEAGGLGHLACTWRDPAAVSALVKTVRARTRRPFGVNFVLGFPWEQTLVAALEAGAPVVSFFWGDGSPYLTRVKAAGATAIQVVGSVMEAKQAADAGFDLVVAQGREAGGHVRGELGTMTLVPQVVDAISPLPVIAAGGIADRRGVAAAAALGAEGVWVGTRFLAAAEADIHPAYQERVLAACGADTVHSLLFDIGWTNTPHRTIRNSTVRNWERAGRPLAPNRPGEGDVLARRADGSALPRYHFGSPTRSVTGDAEALALYAGEGVGLVRSVEPAADIVRELSQGFTGDAVNKTGAL